MNQRCLEVSNYLRCLDSSLRIGWLNTFNRPVKSIHDRFSLLHPWHLSEIDLPPHHSVDSIQKVIQGDRNFRGKLASKACTSKYLWGYDCEFNSDIQKDHLFPYSLGGPTVNGNMLGLCRYHNMVKSSDVHCYPWEDFGVWAEPWLDLQIDKLRTLIFDMYG